MMKNVPFMESEYLVGFPVLLTKLDASKCLEDEVLLPLNLVQLSSVPIQIQNIEFICIHVFICLS